MDEDSRGFMEAIVKKTKDLTANELDCMYEIEINNLKQIIPDFVEKDGDKDSWSNSLLSHDYDVVLVFDNEELVAFLSYYIHTDEAFLCEIDLKDEYKGDHKTFRLLLTTFFNNLNNPNIPIRGKIREDNQRSLSAFTHVGMKQVAPRTYETDYDTFEGYIKKRR